MAQQSGGVLQTELAGKELNVLEGNAAAWKVRDTSAVATPFMSSH